MQQAEEWAKEQGKHVVWLDYLATNEGAVQLYKSCGYKDLAEFTDAKKKKLRRVAAKYFNNYEHTNSRT